MAHPYPLITDPARPQWHFGPPAYWMNDPNGACWHDGWCHLFYQHNPHGDEWGDIHWGHARSRDLVHWEHLPLALRPQLGAGEKHCYSGCLAFTVAGTPRILYTSVKTDPAAPATQVPATPADPGWRTWNQPVATPFLDLSTHDGPAFDRDWRDPFVFREAGRTFLILGATLGDETVIPLYENPAGDLQQWHYRGIIHRAPRSQTVFLECPNLVRLGDKWLLLTSPCREVEWHSGTLDLQTCRFHAERMGVVDASDHYYATHPAADPTGRTVLFGWAQKFPKHRGWNGCLGVPRRVWLDDDGWFCSEPVAELAALRTGETAWPAKTLSSTPLSLPLPAGARHEGELTLARPAAATITFAIAGITLAVGPAGVQFDQRPPVPLPAGETRLQLRWLLDGSLLEVFVNDRAAYTRVVAFPVAATATLTATNGPAQLVAGTGWTLRAAPPTLD